MSAKLLQERQFGILTNLFPIPTPTQTTTKPTDSTSSTSSTHSTSSSSTSSTTSSSSTSTSTTSSSSSSISSSTTVVVTTVAGQTITLTASAGGPPTISPNPATATAFLQNKVLSGVILGIVGLVGLTILIVIATCIVKRRRNKKLLREAVMFDPVSVDSLESGTMEKPSSLGHERDSAEYGSRPYPTPYMYPTTAPHGGVGHFQPSSSSAWATPVERQAYP